MEKEIKQLEEVINKRLDHLKFLFDQTTDQIRTALNSNKDYLCEALLEDNASFLMNDIRTINYLIYQLWLEKENAELDLSGLGPIVLPEVELDSKENAVSVSDNN